MNHEHFMREAIKEAELALQAGDWPIGCVITIDDKIVSRGRNRIYSLQDRLAHAEVNALNKIPEKLFESRKIATVYTTYEPCPMCFGAIMLNRAKRLVYGTCIDDSGYTEFVEYLPIAFRKEKYDVEVIKGVLEKECREVFVKNRFGLR